VENVQAFKHSSIVIVMSKKICLIGAGNVGHHLGMRLFKKGHDVVQVFSRRLEKAASLASEIKATAINDLGLLVSDADFYIIAVHDDAIQEVSNQINQENGIVVHTSGSINTSVLSKHAFYGSFYPLQTFTINKLPDWKTIPFCFCGNDISTEKKIKKLVQSISKNEHLISDEERLSLHLPAVIVNNFTNHLIGIAKDICEEKSVPFELLVPLLRESLKKAENHDPFEIQTGPAKRDDQKTIKKHLSLLKNEQYRSVYQLLSESILKTNVDKK